MDGTSSTASGARALRAGIEATLGDVRGRDYGACVALLTRRMGELFPALTAEANPVAARIETWDAADLGFIIQEYSGFSNAALHMFLEARVRNRWPALRDEIIRNMDEEFGILTRGVPHLELMRYGYREELGLETDGLSYTDVTLGLNRRLSEVFCTQNNVYLAGALLAFEATAVDEFRCVDVILRRRGVLIGRPVAAGSLTEEYIGGHVTPGAFGDDDPEVSHFNGMIEAIGANVGPSDTEFLARSFMAVCLELARWWEEIATEARLSPVREALRRGRERPDPRPSASARPQAAAAAGQVPDYAPVA